MRPRQWITDAELKDCKRLSRTLKAGWYADWEELVRCYARLLREVINCHKQIGEMEDLIGKERNARKFEEKP